MKAMLDWVKKNNPGDRSKFIIAVVIFIAYYLCFVLMSEEQNGGFFIGGCFIAFIIAMDAGRYFINRYLKIYAEELLLGEKVELIQVIRFHPFDVEEYFEQIRRKMSLPVEIMAGYVFVLAFLAGVTEEIKMDWKRFILFLFIGGLCVVAPYVTYFLKKRLFYFQLRAGKEGKLHIALSIGKALFIVPEFIVGITALVVSTLFLSAMLIGAIEPKIDDSMLICRHSHEFMYYYIFLLLAVVGGIWVLCNGLSTKRRKVLCAGTVISFLVAACMLVYTANTYTEVQKDKIIIYHFGVEREYQIEDIEEFRIYAEEENEQIQMELTFGDGACEKIIGTSQSCSDLYEKTYFSDYNFVADYVEKMLDAGAEGKLEDVEELEGYIKELAPEAEEGMKKIVELME